MQPFGGAWVGDTLIRAAAGLCVSSRPRTQECQGCGLSVAASRAVIPEMCRNAPPPPALIRFLAHKHCGRHQMTQTKESSSCFPRART